MARIPTQIALADTRGLRSGTVQAPPVQIGGGLAAAGEELARIGAQIRQADAEQAFTQAELGFRKDLNQFVRQAETDQDPDTLERRYQDYVQDRQAHWERQAGGRNAELWASRAAELGEAYSARVYGVATGKIHDRAKARLGDSLTTAGDLAIEATSHPERDLLLVQAEEQIDTAILSGVMSEVEGQRLRNGLRERVALGYAERVLQADPAAMLDIQNSPQFADLSPEQRFDLETKAAKEIERRQAVARAELNSLSRDHLASIQATGIGMPGLDARAEATLAGEDLTNWRRSTTQARVTFNTMQELRFATPAQMREALDAITPQPGTQGFADALNAYEAAERTAIGILQKREADPAGYAMQAPEVAQAMAEAQNGQRSMDSALTLRMERQADMGISQPVVLAKQEAEATVMALQRMPGQERAVELGRLMEGYGSHSSQAMRDLVRAGLDRRSVVLASLYDNPGLAQRVGGIMDLGSKELRDNLPPGIANDVEEAVNTALEGMRGAMLAGDLTGGGIAMANEIAAMSTDLALFYYRQTGDAAGSAEKAAAEIVNSRYQVIEADDMHVYMPNVVDGVQIDPAAVEAAGRRGLDRTAIEAFNPVPTGSFDPGVTPDLLMERYVRAAMNAGQWITAPDGLGMVLAVPHEDGTLLPMMNARGEYYRVSFAEASMAPVRQTVPDRRNWAQQPDRSIWQGTMPADGPRIPE